MSKSWKGGLGRPCPGWVCVGAVGVSASPWHCCPALQLIRGEREAIILDAIGSCTNAHHRHGRCQAWLQARAPSSIPTLVCVSRLPLRAATAQSWADKQQCPANDLQGLWGHGQGKADGWPAAAEDGCLSSSPGNGSCCSLFSQSCSPGLTLMAEFVGAAMSWLLVKTFGFVAYWGFENDLAQRKMHLLGDPYFRMNPGVL